MQLLVDVSKRFVGAMQMTQVLPLKKGFYVGQRIS
jgi:hypothetical protein